MPQPDTYNMNMGIPVKKKSVVEEALDPAPYGIAARSRESVQGSLAGPVLSQATAAPTAAEVDPVPAKRGMPNRGARLGRGDYYSAVGDTAPAVNTFMGKKLTADQLAGGETAARDPVIQARMASSQDRSGQTEGERQKLLSTIQGQLNGLGPLNMASKRRLAGDLLGLQSELGKQRQGQLADGDKLATGVDGGNADRALGADVATADFANKGMTRRSEANTARMKLDADNDPNSLANKLKIRADQRAQNADGRAAETQDNANKMQRDKFDQGQVDSTAASLMKLNPALTPMEAQAQAQSQLATNNLRTDQPNDTTASALGTLNIKNQLADTINQGQSFGSQMLDAFDNTGRGIVVNDGQLQRDNVDPSRLSVNKRGGLVPIANALLPGQPFNPYALDAPVDPNTGNAPSTTLSTEEAKKIREQLELFKPKVKKKSEDS